MTIPSLVTLIALALPGSEVQAKPAPPSVDETIARALKSHPEILAAEAKLAGAKAELELAKLSLSQRILKAKNRLEAARQAVAFAEMELKRTEELYKSKATSSEQLTAAREKVRSAMALVAEAEAEWNVYLPAPMETNPFSVGTPGMPTTPATPTQTERNQYELLSKTVRFKKAEKLDLVEAAKALQALPELKGLTLRVPIWFSKTMIKEPPLVELGESELSAAGWLQLFADEFNAQVPFGTVPESRGGGSVHDWYIREYGLVFEKVANRPVGAQSLAEFLKEMRNAPPAGGGAFRNQTTDQIVKRLLEADKNADGQLSPLELPADLRARFAEFDLNKDGLLDSGEIRKLAEKLILERK